MDECDPPCTSVAEGGHLSVARATALLPGASAWLAPPHPSSEHQPVGPRLSRLPFPALALFPSGSLSDGRLVRWSLLCDPWFLLGLPWSPDCRPGFCRCPVNVRLPAFHAALSSSSLFLHCNVSCKRAIPYPPQPGCCFS
jgi:hypothetical protein